MILCLDILFRKKVKDFFFKKNLQDQEEQRQEQGQEQGQEHDNLSKVSLAMVEEQRIAVEDQQEDEDVLP